MKTWSDRRQAALFKIAREYRQMAAEILDSVSEQPVPVLRPTAQWAKSHARKHALEAQEFEDRAWRETTMISGGTRAALTRSHNLYRAAIDRFERRLVEDGLDPSRLDDEHAAA